MISRRDVLLSGAGAAATGLAGLSPAFAQAGDYPNKPIHAICMFPPGAGADVIVRFFAKQLSDQMGKPVVVENKAGAFGNLASEAVARATRWLYAVCSHLFRHGDQSGALQADQL